MNWFKMEGAFINILSRGGHRFSAELYLKSW